MESFSEEPWMLLVHNFEITSLTVAISVPVTRPLLYKRESSTTLEGGKGREKHHTTTTEGIEKEEGSSSLELLRGPLKDLP
jgi:hypothetical protein